MAIELDPQATIVQQIWSSPQLAVIVPTYKERDNVVSLFDLVTKALGDIPFEFIVVDDNSPDGTAKVRGARWVGRSMGWPMETLTPCPEVTPGTRPRTPPVRASISGLA